MFFVITCFDRPGAAQVRGKMLPDHLRYLEEQADKVHAGGPLKDPIEGSMVGSLYIVDVPDYDAARQFIGGEPLQKARLFESMTVRGWTQMQPEVTPGANELTAQEVERQEARSHQTADLCPPCSRKGSFGGQGRDCGPIMCVVPTEISQ